MNISPWLQFGFRTDRLAREQFLSSSNRLRVNRIFQKKFTGQIETRYNLLRKLAKSQVKTGDLFSQVILERREKCLQSFFLKMEVKIMSQLQYWLSNLIFILMVGLV